MKKFKKSIYHMIIIGGLLLLYTNINYDLSNCSYVANDWFRNMDTIPWVIMIFFKMFLLSSLFGTYVIYCVIHINMCIDKCLDDISKKGIDK